MTDHHPPGCQCRGCVEARRREERKATKIWIAAQAVEVHIWIAAKAEGGKA